MLGFAVPFSRALVAAMSLERLGTACQSSATTPTTCGTRHRRPAGVRVVGIACVGRGTRARARRDDVRLDPAGAVSRDRPAAAEPDDRVRAGRQRAGRVRRGVDRDRVLNRAAVRARVARGGLDEDAGGGRVLDDRLQRRRCATFARRTGPAVVHHVRPKRRIRVLPLEVRRGHEELEALGVCRRRSVPLIHVPAADPLGSRSDADLVDAGIAVVTRGRAGRVGAVEVVVARLLVVRRTDSAAGVNGVPPVVVVVRARAVPAAVVRLQRVVRPANTGVLVRDHDPGAVEAKRPDVRRLDLVDPRLDRLRLGWSQSLDHRHRVESELGNCRLVCLEPVRRLIRLDDLDVRPGGKALDEITVGGLRDNRVRSPERLVRHALGLEQSLDRPLSPVRRSLERAIDVPPLSVLVPHAVRGAQVRLLREIDDDRGLAPTRGVAQYPILDLPGVPGDRLQALTTAARQNRCYSRDQPCEREQDRDLCSSTHSDSPSLGLRCPRD